MNTQLMFSSATDEWETPQALFDELDREFQFDLDVCATDRNAKCPVYFTKMQDGLSKKWGGYMVPLVDGLLTIGFSDSLSETAMNNTPPRKICSSNPRQLDEIPTGILVSRTNISSPIGWKWAQREDAEWMVNQLTKGEYEGKIWGMNNEMLKGWSG